MQPFLPQDDRDEWELSTDFLVSEHWHNWDKPRPCRHTCIHACMHTCIPRVSVQQEHFLKTAIFYIPKAFSTVQLKKRSSKIVFKDHNIPAAMRSWQWMYEALKSRHWSACSASRVSTWPFRVALSSPAHPNPHTRKHSARGCEE